MNRLTNYQINYNPKLMAIVRAHEEAGGQFFNPDVMRYFSTSVVGQVIADRYFITGDKPHGTSERRYTIRKLGRNGAILTVGKFRGYASESRASTVVYQIERRHKQHLMYHRMKSELARQQVTRATVSTLTEDTRGNVQKQNPPPPPPIRKPSFTAELFVYPSEGADSVCGPFSISLTVDQQDHVSITMPDGDVTPADLTGRIIDFVYAQSVRRQAS